MYVLSIGLLVTLFAACSDPAGSSGATPTPTSANTTPTLTTAATATQPATTNQPATPTPVAGTGKAPTTVAKATSATTANQPAAPTSVTGTATDLQPFTGVDFTMLYPAKWQKTHKSGSPVAANQPPSQTYRFVAADNVTGFLVKRHSGEQAVGGSVNELLGGEFRCDTGDKSVPSSAETADGVSWSQVDLICLVASNNYEVRELVRSDSQYGQTVIMYGAYQKVGNGAVVPDFAHTKATYFDPMLASFKFK
ncbi:hypothetical protein KSF_053350 [Reticulibacter mediterranei]|uniref:Lipoprotein n=2 Tax=Reticulibacter mediterranei TaxID=2778369 RepID=A0A8J3N2A9_9CHLR|nr:hypothetical protein KSF_053350 [Reticulibacter mediterranei]